MKKAIAIVSVLLIASVLVLLVWRGLEDTTNRKLAPVARLNLPFPSFQLSSLLSDKVYTQLPANTPVLVNVWATWCPSCYIEHPYLLTLAEQGIMIIGLNYKDDREQAQLFLANKGNPYHMVLFDGTGTLALDLGVTGAPETYFVDAHGVVRYRHVGLVDADTWKALLHEQYQAL